jgi:glycerophosphoryl diester phosphodiesterase
LKRGKWSILLLLIVIALAGCGRATAKEEAVANETTAKEKEEKQSALADKPVVLHGLGYIDGHMVTNSIEAFTANYNRGFRVFEVDLQMTSDNRLIARHDWELVHYEWLGQEVPEVGGPKPFDEVMAMTIHGKYKAPSWEQILELMQKYPDVYFVTDSKDKDEAIVRQTFSYLVEATKKVDPALLDRVIPQIYDKPMLGYIKDYHDFNEVIYTLYKHTNEDIPTPKDLAEWSAANNVTAVAALPFRLTEEMQAALNEKNITIYTHTINNPDHAATYRSRGWGIYTDYLYYDGENYIAP